jgi:hypothetical protein
MTTGKLASLCAGVLAAISICATPNALAGPVVVLKAHDGRIIASYGKSFEIPFTAQGSFHVTTTVIRHGKSYKEHYRCSSIHFQGFLTNPEPSNRVPRQEEGSCIASKWFRFEHSVFFDELALSAPSLVSARIGAELEHEEAVEGITPNQPRVCVYRQAKLRAGTFQANEKPLVLKLNANPEHVTAYPGEEEGCAASAEVKAKLALLFNGEPLLAALAEPPSVARISPDEGAESGGTKVTVTGANFTPSGGSEPFVSFGPQSAENVTTSSGASISAVSPKGSGAVDVTVETAVGSSATSSADLFTYRAPPAVTEVNPKLGLESGGTEVTITGSKFTPGSTVRFGATPAAAVKVNSEESLTATSPKGSGTVHVTVTTAGGTSATSAADEFTYVPLV